MAAANPTFFDYIEMLDFENVAKTLKSNTIDDSKQPRS